MIQSLEHSIKLANMVEAKTNHFRRVYENTTETFIRIMDELNEMKEKKLQLQTNINYFLEVLQNLIILAEIGLNNEPETQGARETINKAKDALYSLASYLD